MRRRAAASPLSGAADVVMPRFLLAAILLAAVVAWLAPALAQGTAPTDGAATDQAAPDQAKQAEPAQSANAPSADTQQAAPQASPTDIDGETMFATSCGWCHQQGGRVAGRGPKLAGDEHSDDYLIDRIKHGKGGAMPAFGRVFSDGQIIAILAYIRSLDDSGG
jgi:mono/diheme cytochrome c family protein